MPRLILFPPPDKPGQPKVTLSVSSEPEPVAEVRVDLHSIVRAAPQRAASNARKT
ncbi:MAG TPA: hypothetical protein VGK32_17600 [Vicinamibacterales bacterium]|jgi:hypothetical protein